MFSLYIFFSIFLPTYGLVMLLYHLWGWLSVGIITSNKGNDGRKNIEEWNGK